MFRSHAETEQVSRIVVLAESRPTVSQRLTQPTHFSHVFSVLSFLAGTPAGLSASESLGGLLCEM